MTFTPGDKIKLNGMDGVVLLVGGSDALLVQFDGAIHTDAGGLLIGTAPLLLQDDGRTWCEIIHNTAVQLEKVGDLKT